MRSAFCLAYRSEVTRWRLPERGASGFQAVKNFLDNPKYVWYRSSHDAAIIVLLRARRAATEGAAAFQAGVHNPDPRRRRNLETAK